MLADAAAGTALGLLMGECWAAKLREEFPADRFRVYFTCTDQPALRVHRVHAGEDLLIADGHHRYTVALAFREEMRRRQGPGPWDRIMMLIVDAASEDPPVLPIHRILATGAPEIDKRGPKLPMPRMLSPRNAGTGIHFCAPTSSSQVCCGVLNQTLRPPWQKGDRGFPTSKKNY